MTDKKILTKKEYEALTERLNNFKYWKVTKDNKKIPVFKVVDKEEDRLQKKILANNTRLQAREMKGSELLNSIKAVCTKALELYKLNESYLSTKKRHKNKLNRK